MKPLSDYSDKSVGEIVRADYRTANVFKAYGINYCCNGNISLKAACEQKNIDLQRLSAEVDEVVSLTHVPKTIDYTSWRTDFLVDYIVNIHHAYLRDAIPALLISFDQVLKCHGNEYPYLNRTYEVLNELCVQVAIENKRQEEVEFPYIKQLDTALRRKEPYGKLFVRTLRKPVNMKADQPKLNDLLLELRSLTRNYDLSNTACTSLYVITHKLRELDHDLVQHKHLENNILFPKTLEMESELLQS